MSKHLQKWILLLFVLCSGAVFAQHPTVSPKKGVLRVKLQPEVAAQVAAAPRMRTAGGIVSTGITPLDRAGQKVKAVQMKRVFPYVEKFEAQRKEFGLDRWYEITFDEGVNPLEAKQIYSTVPGIQVAENIIPMELLGGNGGYVKLTPAQKAAMNAQAPSSDMPFNDPRLPLQWHYQNDGSMPGSVKGADINLFEAWKLATGSRDVLIAIIDGGVDFTHEDLAENMWINEAELNGTKGVDDDGNGYVDDIYGYNFVTNSGELYPHNHGTHVAGTVAAVNNNGIGVSGVAGGNGQGGVRLLSCQVFDSRTGAGDGNFAAALVYAAEMGASIAQCSWGWPAPDIIEQAVLDAIDYFTAKGGGDKLKGGLCIFSSGNDGSTGNYYPGCYEKVLCVGAMNYDKTVSSYSNYGDWVDVTAPGGLMDFDASQGVLSTLPGNEYGYNEGTSMATPHVSGIAALILSKYGKPDLSNETLREQLVTSVNDLYTDNPRYAGLAGSGYIDAWKALQMSDGEAPEPVSDFTLLPAQDNIMMEWIIPGASDNNVNHHTVYYSDKEFNSGSDLTKLESVTIDTKFLKSGDKITYELKGLEARTTYFIAIKSVDRWGNAAALSPVKSATTNSGPKMVLDKQSISMTVDAASSLVASDKFTISNEDEGLLKWESYSRTVNVMPASLVKADPGKLKAYDGNLSIVSYAKNPVVSADFMTEDFPLSINYASKELVAYIGDVDLNLPNSQAQWFKVDPDKYPDGFNLTHLNVGGSYGKDPVIEIYEGSTITKSKLVQRFTGNFAYYFDVPLDEQLYFAPGESFWIVLHFAKGNVNPLGLGEAETDDYATYSYMSNDLGNTWMILKDALVDSKYEEMGGKAVWDITAKSLNPDWSTMMVLNPENGTVKAHEKQEVTISNDGQKLVNGSYKFSLKLKTNETGKTEQAIPVAMTVKGNKPELKTAKVIDFGDLLVGQTKTLKIEVINNGYGGFYGSYGSSLSSSNIKSSSDQFVTPTYISGGFPARSVSSMEITYAPTKAGSHSGTVTLTDGNNVQYQFIIRGIAADPAEIVIAPTDIQVGELEVGATPIEKSFTISNTGSYPLEYVFPKFSDEVITDMGKASHKFGYTYISNLDGATDFEYDNNPALVNATDITSQFTDDNVWSKAISLGFSFPYYGETYDKVYVTSHGGIAMATGRFCMFPSASADCVGGMGAIMAYGTQLIMGANSKVEWAKQDGKFVVKFTNVMAVVYDNDYIPVSFHMALASNGDVEIFYDDYTPASVFGEGSNLFVGLNDIEVKDPMTLTDTEISDDPYSGKEPTEEGQLYKKIGTGSAVKFLAPDKYIINKLIPANGVINPGEKSVITVTMAATEDMYAGELTNKLVLLSNDPKHTTSYVTFRAVVKGDVLKPLVELASSDVDFGNVFRTAVKQLPVTIKNVGKDVLNVTSVTLAEGKFNFEARLPISIEPGLSKDILVTLPTEKEGEVADVMTVVTSAGTVTANLVAKVIGTPVIALNMEGITETMESGTTMEKVLEIKNEGNEPLVYSITPNEFIGLPPAATDGKSSVDYIYSASVDNKDVSAEWVDIETNGLGEQNNLTYYMQHDFTTVDLPFDFPFYGKTYNKMYIYNSGFISFNEKTDDKIWPEPPSQFPTTETLYTNMIAPYWGMHSMDQTRTAGTFHYITEDRAVVSFMEYGNTMNRGVCFQVIMNKDGSFKFQYKGAFPDADIYNMFGWAGIANDGGTKGVNLPARTVAFGRAIEFYPVMTEEIATGSAKNVNMKVMANKMAGDYTSNLILNTNVPGKEKINLPIELNITGMPKPVFPEKIETEWVVGTNAGSMGVPEVLFKVANQGTATFMINNIEMDAPMSDFGPVLQLWYYGEHYDPWFDETTIGWGIYEEGTSITVGVTPIEFKVLVTDNYTINTYECPITFNVTGIEGKEKVEVPFKVSITDAPVMDFDKPEIRVSNVASDYEGEAEMTITNNGAYPLRYEISLDPTGEGEVEEEQGGGGVDPMSEMGHRALSVGEQQSLSRNLTEMDRQGLMKVAAKAGELNALDVPVDMEYNQSLYYPAMPETSAGVYQYGSGTVFGQYKAATYYVAPATGFNLTHVYTAATVKTLENVDFKVEIVKGKDLETGVVIGSGSYHLDKQPDPNYGLFMTIPLEKAAYLHPNEKFHVVVTYPVGYITPAILVTKEEAVVSNRYMGWQDGYGWFDVATLLKENVGSVGYIMSCIEEEAGSSWVTMLTPDTSGELAIGASKTVKVKLAAETAPLDRDNKAVLVIKSNDPDKQLVNYPVYLDKNGAPEISVPSSKIYAKEGATTKLNVTVTDSDGDAFSVKLNDESGIAKMESATVTSGNATVEKVDDTTIKVLVGSEATTGAVSAELALALTPDYGTAGSHSFELTATDVKNNVRTSVVNYTVDHVNRAPIAKEQKDMEVKIGSTSPVLYLSSLFEDPDGDELTYKVSASKNDIVDIYNTVGSVIFSGLKLGAADITVTATDVAGASAVCKFKVKVVTEVGIGEVDMKNAVAVYPNPVVDKANVACDIDAEGEISYKLYNANGALLYNAHAVKARGEVQVIDMDGFASGVYYLELDIDGTKTTVPVMKK